MTTSASSAASVADTEACPPLLTNSSLAFKVGSKPMTSNPALTKLIAIGNPIFPSPITATFAVLLITFIYYSVVWLV